MNQKVTVVGADRGRATTAQGLTEREHCGVAMINTGEGMPQKKTLHFTETALFEKYIKHLIGTGKFGTAGIPRMPGISRFDLLAANRRLMQNVVIQTAGHSLDTTLIDAPIPCIPRTVWSKRYKPISILHLPADEKVQRIKTL